MVLRSGFCTGSWQNYTHAGSSHQQMVVATEKNTPETYWIIKVADGRPPTVGEVVQQGMTIRLEHLATRMNLHSHTSPAPFAPDQKEITGYCKPASPGEGDDNDDWRLEKTEHQHFRVACGRSDPVDSRQIQPCASIRMTLFIFRMENKKSRVSQEETTRTSGRSPS